MNSSADSAYIVTGTTRGLGRALARAVRERGKLLFTISRSPQVHEGRWHNYACDLRQPDQIQRAMADLMQAIGRERCHDILLINNAGVLSPIGPIENAADDRIEGHFAVNLQAPALLIAHFIRAAGRFSGRRRIINITSGAGENAYAGWAPYCAAKAALNMLTACVALEQSEQERPVSICAVAPGVVDTDMQLEIRRTSRAEFPKRKKFQELYASGRLAAPEQVAHLILDLDEGGLLASGALYDLRDVRPRPGGGWEVRRRNLP